MTLFRSGYTTGTCAAAAAKAAMLQLARGEQVREVTIQLPGGEPATLPIAWVRSGSTWAQAAVTKDAGDDPDVTHQSSVLCRVEWHRGDEEVHFAAGEGVGTVGKPGLQIPPGEPAINPVPRQMIREAIREISGRGVIATVSIPGGVELAAKTYNPRLGVTGGLSILGTTGIVRPFSHDSIRETIRASLSVALACGHRRVALAPGNIGYRAACERLSFPAEQVVEVSNEWDVAMEVLRNSDVEALALVGHPGKLAKLAEGIWQTHSAQSPSASPYVRELASGILGRQIAESATVDGIFTALDAASRRKVADALAAQIAQAVQHQFGRPILVGVLLTSMDGEIWGSNGEAPTWI